MTISSKRAEYVALLSLILNVVFFIVAFLIGRWSGFFAVNAASWFILSAALISLVLCLQFHQRALAEQEKLDMSQMAKTEQAPTIFQAKKEHAALFTVAQNRLAILEKWFIPSFSSLIAVYQLVIGLYLLKSVTAVTDTETKQPLLSAICMTAIAFISFLISRYATGMSAQLLWKPLRAAGSCLIGVAVLCFALAVGLSLVQFKIFVVVNTIAWVIPILLVLLGAETALNVVFDIYRPRLKGQYSRSAFDSRLLSVINEPGGIFHSVASAIDYQFGFKVSETWFYKLLEKAILPLVLFAAVTLYLLSCFLVVSPNEEAIIEHFGNPLDQAGEKRIVGPGLTLKWPWPVDIAYKYPTKSVSEIAIGFVPKIDPKTGQVEREPRLWGKTHHAKENNLLVASESRQVGTGAVPVSFVIAAVSVQYKIKDLYPFLYNYSNSEKVLESICYRELTKLAASAKIEVENAADMNQSLLGAGRAQAEESLTASIQAAADEAGLGVEVVFLGLQGLHPPPEVAADYQKVVGAVQKRQALILEADAEKNKILSSLAGSVEEADRLYTLAAEYQQAKDRNENIEAGKLAADLDLAFANAKGDIFKTLSQANSYAFEKATSAQATSLRFENQLKAYRAAKEIYKRQQRLAVLEEALKDIRKFLIVADTNDTQVFIVNLEEKLTPDLYELSGFEESSKK